MAEFTPMMQKYLETKEEYKDCILFYRLGDFYEMFFDDALTASKELEITLTGKACGQEERAPMCGIPFHAVDGYLNKLVSKGYKVAICEQVEDPKTAKGLVKREVVRIVTPGTNLNVQVLDEKKNNYICCVYADKKCFGLSVCDVSTGYFVLSELENITKVCDELVRFQPAEIICNHDFLDYSSQIRDLKDRLGIPLSGLDKWYFSKDGCNKALCQHFHVSSLIGQGVADFPIGIIAAGSLMQYLTETQKNDLAHISSLKLYDTGSFMFLDSSTRRNLELTETMREKRKTGSLLGVLDRTKTAMGGRLLRSYVEQPLVSASRIHQRQDAVEALKNDMITREELREYLNSIYDLERLMGRISYQSANPRDLIAFKSSLEYLPAIKAVLRGQDSELLKEIQEKIDPLEDLYELIDASIIEEPPISVREGGIIKDGFSEVIDQYRNASVDGKKWLADIEAKEREKTGIKNLKIKYNKVFGYYLEVTKSFANLVPDYFIRKQTLVNAERYITPELKELEDKILGAEDKLVALEYDTFCMVRDTIKEELLRIQSTAQAIASLDVYASLAAVAEKNRYVRPQVTDEDQLSIQGGRHPVVEQSMNHELFVDNDTYFDRDSHRIAIITGPNMAGKSTYMRQVALIVLMAQIGSFVPASKATIGVVDRIFTRVGASDDLSSGQSTFMLEMNEVANILRNATSKSLIILDEVGRGTSTYDGLSIAWSVVEHISKNPEICAKTLFATHYHELTEIENILGNVKNYSIAVKENGDDIVFLRKIKEGGADRSYGIQVAKLAGVPDTVISRAKEILSQIVSEKSDETLKIEAATGGEITPAQEVTRPDSTYDFDVNEFAVVERLKSLDLGQITPLEAINILYELQEPLQKEEK